MAGLNKKPEDDPEQMAQQLTEALQLQKDGFMITGPKKLRCFGASYLYPIFIRIGVIQN